MRAAAIELLESLDETLREQATFALDDEERRLWEQSAGT